MNFWYDWGVSINSVNSGIIHVAYYKWPGRNLNYAWKIDDIWSIETVDSDGAVGSFCSIDIDTDGYPSISYMDRSHITLKMADKLQYSPSKPQKPSSSQFGLLGREYIFTTSSDIYAEIANLISTFLRSPSCWFDNSLIASSSIRR